MTVFRAARKSFSHRELLLSVFMHVSATDIASLHYFGVFLLKDKSFIIAYFK